MLFAFVGAWNNFFLPLLVLRDAGVQVLTVGLANWNALAAQPGQAQVLYAIVVTGSVVAVAAGDHPVPVPAALLAARPDLRRGARLTLPG